MTELIETTRLIFAMLSVLIGTEYHEGGGAYYHRVSMRRVCEHRNYEGWTPERLDCSQTCLAAWGRHDPDMLGRYVLADLPGGSLHV